MAGGTEKVSWSLRRVTWGAREAYESTFPVTLQSKKVYQKGKFNYINIDAVAFAWMLLFRQISISAINLE